MQQAEIKNTYPPNIDVLKAYFPITENQLFAYNGIIYNPSGKPIESHLRLHEETHINQQKAISNWWNKYIEDSNFRLEQEIQAFAVQYAYGKKVYLSKTSDEMLDDFATNLSSPLYGNIIEKEKAKTAIRLKAKEYGEKT
jgi:hypothetical protein